MTNYALLKFNSNIILFITGNLTAAIDLSFLRSNSINYIITVDSCPLPEIILDLRDIHIKYIQGNSFNLFIHV